MTWVCNKEILKGRKSKRRNNAEKKIGGELKEIIHIRKTEKNPEFPAENQFTITATSKHPPRHSSLTPQLICQLAKHTYTQLY